MNSLLGHGKDQFAVFGSDRLICEQRMRIVRVLKRVPRTDGSYHSTSPVGLTNLSAGHSKSSKLLTSNANLLLPKKGHHRDRMTFHQY